MRIVVDVNHPGHVHMFKNFIWNMQKNGHEILITATEKDVTFELLNNYNFDYVNLGSYGKSFIEKLINIPIIDFKMYSAIKNFEPDVFLGVGSIRAAHVSFLLRKKCIIFEDTEHCKEQHLLYVPFTTKILTPSCFKKNLGKKQVQYNGYHELAYLHPNYFIPNPAVLGELGLCEDEKFTVLRFVSWDASHDIGEHGIKNKVKFVTELEKYGHVFITSEGKLEPELNKYKLKVSPEKLHDLLYYASLYVGEGATTAVESALVGTPSIYVSSLVGTMGNLIELDNKYGLIFNYKNSDEAFNKAINILQNPNIKKMWKLKNEHMLAEKIDLTKFMIKFIENYPVF